MIHRHICIIVLFIIFVFKLKGEENTIELLASPRQASILTEFTALQEDRVGLRPDDPLWVSTDYSDVGEFREIYKSKDNQELILLFIEQISQQWDYIVKWQILGNKHQLNKEHFYDDYDYWVVVDPIVYGAVDIAGLIPGVDYIADGAGLLYSIARQDGSNIATYSIAIGVPLAGAAVIKMTKKTFGIFATRGADGLYSFAVKQLDKVDEGDILIRKTLRRNKPSLDRALENMDKAAKQKYLAKLDEATDALIKRLKRNKYYKKWDKADLDKLLKDFKDRPDILARFEKDLKLGESWQILNNTGIEGISRSFDNVEIVNNFISKYPQKIDDFGIAIHRYSDGPEAFLLATKQFDEISTINNTDDLIDVLSSVTELNTVAELEQKGVKSFFRGTTRSKVDGSLFPGNPNTQLEGLSTSTDPVRGTIFAIESASSNPNYNGVLQIGLPIDLKDLKLSNPNRRVGIELEAIMKISASDFAGLSKVEISVEDARKLVKEIYDIDLPSKIGRDYSTELLEELNVSSLEKSIEFYQKALKQNIK